MGYYLPSYRRTPAKFMKDVMNGKKKATSIKITYFYRGYSDNEYFKREAHHFAKFFQDLNDEELQQQKL